MTDRLSIVIIGGFVVYALVLILTQSELFHPVRKRFRRLMVRLGWKKFYARGPADEPLIEDANEHQEIKGYDFISCAMCTGVWVAALTCLYHMGLWDTLGAYGISYYLRTQERP